MSTEIEADAYIKFDVETKTLKSEPKISEEELSLITWTALYVFVSLFISFVIIIWSFVILNIITWQWGALFTVISYVILYGLCVLYRFVVIKDIEKKRDKVISNKASN